MAPSFCRRMYSEGIRYREVFGLIGSPVVVITLRRKFLIVVVLGFIFLIFIVEASGVVPLFISIDNRIPLDLFSPLQFITELLDPRLFFLLHCSVLFKVLKSIMILFITTCCACCTSAPRTIPILFFDRRTAPSILVPSLFSIPSPACDFFHPVLLLLHLFLIPLNLRHDIYRPVHAYDVIGYVGVRP